MNAVFTFPFLLMVFASSGGNDLLDFVPADAYFRLSKIEQTVPALSGLLEAPLPADKLSRPGDSARRQMALRALGKLKDPAALPAIGKAELSDDPLVADYARAARAAIRGEAYQRPGVSAENLAIDLACLPSGLAIVGRLTATPSAGLALDVSEMLKNFAFGDGAPDAGEMETQIVSQLGRVIAAVGNVRIGTITFGVSGEIGRDAGFVVALVRGLYNHEAVGSFLREGVGKVQRRGGGLTFYELESGHVYASPVSDELFVFIAGASRDELPLEEVGRKVAAGGGDFALGRNLAKMLDGIDRAAPIWVLTEVSEAYKRVPFLAAFDTAKLIGKREGKLMKLQIDAEGEDAEGVKAVVDKMSEGLAKAREEIARENEFPGVELVRKMLASIELSADGGSAKVEAEFEGGPAMALLPAFIYLWSDSGKVEPGFDEAIPLEKNALEKPVDAAPGKAAELDDPPEKRRGIVVPPPVLPR